MFKLNKLRRLEVSLLAASVFEWVYYELAYTSFG